MIKLENKDFKFCNKDVLLLLLQSINNILEHIYYLTCKSIKIGLAGAIHKGKDKSWTHHKSFRCITVGPHIGALIDHYLCEPTEAIFRPLQSYTQYGFTANCTYLLGAILRNECEGWAIDNKMTLFQVTCDGDSAFDVTDRDIMIRELHENGEDGDTWRFCRGLYQKTEC